MSTSLESIESAISRLCEAVIPVEPTPVRLREAPGHILRSEIRAESDQPAYDRSAMDGFAVHAQMDDGGGWQVVRDIQAGSPPGPPLAPGTAVGILTGAAVPEGAERVLPVELVERSGNSIRCADLPSTDHIRRRGEDCSAGDLLLESGRAIGPLEIALLAQHGVVEPAISAFPVVLHLALGDELVPAQRQPTGSQIRDTNTPLIRALLQELGWPLEQVRSRYASDSMEAIRTALADLEEARILMLSGGAWKSEKDLAGPILEELGFEWIFRGVDLRPGKPFSAAVRGTKLAFVFPGNPVSHWVTWHVLAKPAIRRLLAATERNPLVEIPLAADWDPGRDRRELRWPARVDFELGKPFAMPLPLSSSGDLSALVAADGLIHHRPGEGHLSEGTLVTFEPAAWTSHHQHPAHAVTGPITP